ncbi:insulin-like growth factor-binding protein complex acid labile subunit [Argopecten irradians]|uniref:insulin-like growth factor-binding protein complex acid labile subunit n=1 Tax=Argopecten irradians TaxID=31199 RepID=UPI0037226CC4
MKRFRDKTTSVCMTLILIWMSTVSCDSCSPICDCVENYFAYCDRRDVTTGHVINILDQLPIRLTYIDISHNLLSVLTENMFHRHGDLTSININHNALRIIGRRTFHPLVRLRKLFLHHNNLFQITSDDFSYLKQLQKLYLNHNRIRVIQERSFAHLENLLELHLERNYLTNVTSQTFIGLTRLRILNLSDNNVHVISDFAFSSLFNLHKLYLNNNTVINLTSHTFSNMTSLRELDLSHNEIESINSSHLDTFKHHIRIIRLSSNRIARLSGDLFREMNKLSVLDLTQNKIKEIDDDVFWYLDLQELYLQANLLTTVTRAMFLYTYSVKAVDFSYNLIHTVSPGSWAGLGQSLLSLNLTGNDLTDLSKSMVQGMEALRMLSVANNQIFIIDSRFIAELPDLQMLDLSGNKLTSLVSRDLWGLELVPRILLERNPLRHFSGFVFVGEIHVSLSLSIISRNDRTVNVTWPYVGGNQLYWSVTVKNMNNTETKYDVTFYLQAYVTSATIPGLSPLTHYFICVRPVFVDESVKVNQIGYVTTSGWDELVTQTTLSLDKQVSRSSRPTLSAILYCLIFMVMVRFTSISGLES